MNENIKLYQGDCLEVLKTIPDKSINLILQDPPYNTTSCDFEWDIFTKIKDFWEQWERVITDNGAIIMFGSQPFSTKLIISNFELFKYEYIWIKSRQTGFAHAKNNPLKAHENILVFSKGQINHIGQSKNRMVYYPQGLVKCEIKRNGTRKGGRNNSRKIARPSNKEQYVAEYTNYPNSILNFKSEPKPEHPTQKPLDLIEYLIKTYTLENETVFDGFSGSGTTAVGCLNTNRKFIGTELLEKYFKIAEERINKAIQEKSDNLFSENKG